MSEKSKQGWKLADGYRDELVKAKARIAALGGEVARLKARLSWIEGQPTCRVGDVLADEAEVGTK